MVVREPFAPGRANGDDLCANALAAFQLDGVPLAVVKPDRFDALEAIERPRETNRRVLAAREENESAHQGLACGPK